MKKTGRFLCIMMTAVILLTLGPAGFVFAAEDSEPIREVHRVKVGDSRYCFFVTRNVVLTPEEIDEMSDSELSQAVISRSGLYIMKSNCRKTTKVITVKQWKKQKGIFLDVSDIEEIRNAEPADGSPVKLHMDVSVTDEVYDPYAEDEKDKDEEKEADKDKDKEEDTDKEEEKESSEGEGGQNDQNDQKEETGQDDQKSDESQSDKKDDATQSGQTDENQSGQTDENQSGQTDENQSGQTDENQSGQTDENQSGQTDNNQSGQTDENQSGQTDENQGDQTDDNQSDQTDENQGDQTDDNQSDQTDEETEIPDIKTVRSLLRPELIFVIVATEEDAKAGDNECKEQKERIPDSDDANIPDVPDDAAEDEALPEFKTIPMADRSGKPVADTLTDGDPVTLEWIEPSGRADKGNKKSFIERIPGGYISLAAALAAASLAAVLITKRRKRNEDE